MFERKLAVFGLGAECVQERIEEPLLGTFAQLWKKSNRLASVHMCLVGKFLRQMESITHRTETHSSSFKCD